MRICKYEGSHLEGVPKKNEYRTAIKMKNKKTSVPHMIILFFFIFSFIEFSSLCATVSCESKFKFHTTDIPHSVDVLDQNLVVPLHVHCNLVRHRLVFVHESLSLKERIYSSLDLILSLK